MEWGHIGRWKVLSLGAEAMNWEALQRLKHYTWFVCILPVTRDCERMRVICWKTFTLPWVSSLKC